MKRAIFILVFIFAAWTGSFLCADQIPGSQYYYLGNGIAFFPLGSAGVSHFMSMDAGLYNPAAYADTRRITADLGIGGLGGDNLLLNARGSFPTNYGVITGNALILTSPDGTTAGDVVGFKGSFAKYISDEWLFGAGLNLGFAKGGPSSELYASFDLGSIYRRSVEGKGFGFFDYSVGAALKNIGKNISYTGYDGFPPLAVDLGGRVEFIRAGIYKSRASAHLAFPFNPFDTFAGFGLENIFLDMVNVKVGLNFGVEDISPISAGFDLLFTLDDTDIQFSYSFLPVKWGGQNVFTHNAGLSVAFGNYDKKAPETAAQAESEYFSPNHDGVNDIVKLDLAVKDNTMVFGWKLDIADGSGKTVKSYVAQDVRKIRHMTLGKYVKRIFAKKQEVEIPKVIEWNGEDSEGKMVEDGLYYYTLKAWDENDNTAVTQRQGFVVDTLVPMVEAKAGRLLFSPNGDGVKDTLTISLKSMNVEEDDSVVLNITDSRNKNVVYQKNYKGGVPETFEWDGKDMNGAPVPEGYYEFNVAVADNAGNKASSSVSDIAVKTEYEKVSVSPSFRAFSPNGDGFYDLNDLKLFASSKEGLLGWKVALLDKDGKAVREFTGEKDFPDLVPLDGKDRNGRPLPDGLYSVMFGLNFESGNHPETYFKFIKIDTTPPTIEASANLNAFSPNGDGAKDTVSFVHKITSGEGDLFEAVVVNAAGATFKSFQYGTNPPGVVVWDGLGDGSVQPVEGVYTYIISGLDDVGNGALGSVGPIRVATGFEQVSVEPSEYAFSPNGDKTKDSVAFKLSTNNRQGIIEWKLDIKDTTGALVRSINDRNAGLALPPEVVWDGKGAAGNVVEDGIYTAVLSMLYDTGNNPISKPKDVRIDNEVPAIEVYVKDLYFSPNGDGRKEALTIYERIKGEAEDQYAARITDSAGRTVREFAWKGNPPAEIVWDGKDQVGKALREGVYNYLITGRDGAGNSSEMRIPGIVLVTSYEKVSTVVSQVGISPNGDGFDDRLEITPKLSSDKDLQSWQLVFYNSQGKFVRTIKNAGAPPAGITWDGKDDNGTAVPDGAYFYSMGLLYKSGNNPNSEPARVVVDTTAPANIFVVQPSLFSPDLDGEADTLYINAELADANEVKDWKIAVYRKWDGKTDTSAPFKVFAGTGALREMFKWDGYSDPVTMPSTFKAPEDISYRKEDGKWAVLVDSASTYAVELTASDAYKNSVVVQREFDTDILVIPTPYGLKIMINSIQFEFDKAELLPQSFEILDRLIGKLEKFPAYKIRIAGHTDSKGTDEYNQKLSERRALSVYKYLVEHDMDKERLSTEGFGELSPIDDNEIESGRARNRRVEFYLTKKP